MFGSPKVARICSISSLLFLELLSLKAVPLLGLLPLLGTCGSLLGPFLGEVSTTQSLGIVGGGDKALSEKRGELDKFGISDC